MTSLTLILFAIMVAAAISRAGYWRALAIAGGTPVGAALIVGDVAVPTFYMAAVGAAVGVLIRLLRRTRRNSPPAPLFRGAVPLILFVVWSILTTLLAQTLFVGTAVFLGPDPDSVGVISGTPTTSNIAQIGYLILSVAVVFFLAGSSRLGPGVVGIPAIILAVLSFWRFLGQNFGLPFPEGFFDNNTTYRFIETLPGGAPRFRGILSEPASLAVGALVAISYTVSRAIQVRGWRRVWMIAVAAMSLIMASVSTSATFFVVAVILALIASVAVLNHVVVRRGGIQHFVVIAAVAAGTAALWVVPYLVDLLSAVVGDKVGSSSFSDRSLSDARSYSILVDTFGLGVGLGSNRSSSFLAATLSTTGLIGAALLAVAIFIIVRNAMRVREFHPVIWAFVAMLVCKLVSAPDLADTSGILWLSLGALAYAGMRPAGSELGAAPVLGTARPAARHSAGVHRQEPGA